MTRTLCAIGNFDGVHRGHRAVLARAAKDARDAGLEPVLLTFEPHPAVTLGRQPPALLTPLARKIELVQRIDPALRVVIEHFDKAFSELGPEEFVRDVLVKKLAVARVVVGRNFRFGKGRQGDLARLSELGARHGFVAQATELFGDERGPWSSTRVRQAIARGDLEEAELVLGRPHALTGVVAHGDQRGRQLGFPTANLVGVEEARPPHGVYAVLVDQLDEKGSATKLARGVANLGVRPTFETSPAIEAHLLDFAGDLYGKKLRLHLVARLRDEMRFASLDELKARIARDIEQARAVLASRTPDEAAHGAWY